MDAEIYDEKLDTPAWRQPAPGARRAVMALYSWQDPGWAFLGAILAATPFIVLTALSPVLLSLDPTTSVIAPIANARALEAGVTKAASELEPFYLFLLILADKFVDTPGRIHLAAKAVAAVLAVYPLAYFTSVRLPVLQTITLTAALAAFIIAPFSGPSEIALAYFAVLAVGFLAGPADEKWDRALLEGLLSSALMFALWNFNPVFSLATFLLLSACPFLTGRYGLVRYFSALVGLFALGTIAELSLPGINLARASMASGILDHLGANLINTAGIWGLAGVAVSTIAVIMAAAVFGGDEHRRGWLVGACFLAGAFIIARIAGAQPMPLFAIAAAMAALSVYSPFYDGVFRDHDRASISISGVAAALTLFWTAAVITQSVGQLALQVQLNRRADDTTRAAFALVHPGGARIAAWIEEGRFSTPDAQSLFATGPIDQTSVLLEAAGRAEALVEEGVDVAILTGADTACVIISDKPCLSDGKMAAVVANVVFVPRIDLDPATKDMKGRAEALLYTEFKLAERTSAWDVWVRRGFKIPTDKIRVGKGL
ncbi:MAG: hypothetical protein AAF720_02335 [Pseudomonadota bacterium]